jgi:hypothetical protein
MIYALKSKLFNCRISNSNFGGYSALTAKSREFFRMGEVCL